MTYQIRSAEERRRAIQETAAHLGIDDAFISELVETFYARVRADERLGPIFNGEIDDWPDHLAKLKDFWASVAMNAPGKPVVANVIAEKTADPETIRKLLVEQVCGTVRWRESVLYMKEQGVTDLVELGAGKVLSGMVRRIDRDLTGLAVNGPADIESFLGTL